MSDTDTRDTIWVAIIEHKHGRNVYVGRTEKSVRDQVAGYCDDWWEREVVPITDEERPDDDREMIQRYFEVVENEYLDFEPYNLPQ